MFFLFLWLLHCFASLASVCCQVIQPNGVFQKLLWFLCSSIIVTCPLATSNLNQFSPCFSSLFMHRVTSVIQPNVMFCLGVFCSWIYASGEVWFWWFFRSWSWSWFWLHDFVCGVCMFSLHQSLWRVQLHRRQSTDQACFNTVRWLGKAPHNDVSGGGNW